ncbi:STAS domain-containing protein [Aliiglaciecola sp. 3_MG-2023]|uniref:STAS domain-containing protein n=1 Tax=Aliiglaciecola sp. 3_MG-2023 TaxID=3062644 RepID=UPI0026E18EEC|nr:STAS domain-containing protein [Aliiglaciecola sp. 3_MG-2023]MDO6695100.1 STAS domain-containing protein [Aliiglaciecola sp. 3_MG-2023]
MTEQSNLVEVTSSDNGVFHLKGDLNRETVMKCWPQQKNEIQSSQANGSKLKVDFAEVDQVDTAGLAWVMELSKNCQSANVALELLNLPEGLIKLANLSNVNRILSIQ